MKKWLTLIWAGASLLCLSLLTLPACNLPDEPDDPYNNENSGGHSTTDPEPNPTPSPDPDPDPDPTPHPTPQDYIYTYQIGDVAYEMIRVDVPDGYPFKSFYMMQTEMPIDKNIKFGKQWFTHIDANLDGIIIKAEMQNWLTILREKTNLPFRLPTVDEWIFAASGGVKSKKYLYAGSDDINDVAWYKGNCNAVPHDSAKKKPNELGFYDMSGNYAELCNDMADDIYYVDGPFCGGSYKDVADKCTVASVQPGIRNYTMIPGTRLLEANSVDTRYITFRFVYSIED